MLCVVKHTKYYCTEMDYLTTIPEIKNYRNIYLLNKNSFEIKYRVLCKNNSEYLLILFNANTVDSNKVGLHQLFFKNQIPTNKIISYGMCKNHHMFYMLFDWLQGDNLYNCISKYNSDEQYRLGIYAGKTLKSIHAINYTQFSFDKNNTLEKIDYLVRDYRIGYYRNYPLVSYFIDIFNQNKTNHIEDSVILHGDFSLNNIIIDTNNQLSVIDWVYGASGEPAKDFVRNLVNAEKSQDFACGLIDGYFIDSTPPMSFWRSLKMYTAVHQLELIELHIKYGFQSEEFILNNHKLAYQQYQSTDQLVPDYYLSGRNKNECG